MGERCEHFVCGSTEPWCTKCGTKFVPAAELAREREAREAAVDACQRQAAAMDKAEAEWSAKADAAIARAEKAEQALYDLLTGDYIDAQRDAARRWAKAWKRAAKSGLEDLYQYMHRRESGMGVAEILASRDAAIARAEKAEARCRELEAALRHGKCLCAESGEAYCVCSIGRFSATVQTWRAENDKAQRQRDAAIARAEKAEVRAKSADENCWEMYQQSKIAHDQRDAERAEVERLREAQSNVFNILRKHGLYDSPAYREIALTSRETPKVSNGQMSEGRCQHVWQEGESGPWCACGAFYRSDRDAPADKPERAPEVPMSDEDMRLIAQEFDDADTKEKP